MVSRRKWNFAEHPTLHYDKKIMSTKSSILSLSNNVYFSSALELSQLPFTIIIYSHTNNLTLTHTT